MVKVGGRRTRNVGKGFGLSGGSLKREGDELLERNKEEREKNTAEAKKKAGITRDFIPSEKKDLRDSFIQKSSTSTFDGLKVGINEDVAPSAGEGVDSLGGKFAKAAVKTPILGTSIKTVAAGIARVAGKQQEFEEALGTTTGGNLVNTAATLGTLGFGAYATGAALGARAAAQAAQGAGARALLKGGGTARITATKEAIGFKGGRFITQQRAFTGQPARKSVAKIFSVAPKKAPIAARFATNAKSGVITKGFLVKLGIGLAATNILVDAIGTYPFAGFIKEEASQTTGIGFFQAQKNGDIEGMEEAIQRQEEIVNAGTTIIDRIPYANVQKSLGEYFDSVAVKLESDKRILEQMKGGA